MSGLTVWFTGLSSSGKTTISQAVRRSVAVGPIPSGSSCTGAPTQLRIAASVTDDIPAEYPQGYTLERV